MTGGLENRVHETNGKIFFPKKTGIKIKTNLHQAKQQPLGTVTWGQRGGAKDRAQVLAFHLESRRWGEANAQTQLGGDRDSAQCQGRDIRAFLAAAHALSPVANGMLEAPKASQGSALLTHTFQVCMDMDTGTCTMPCRSHSHWRPTPLYGSPPSHSIPGEQPPLWGQAHTQPPAHRRLHGSLNPDGSGRKSLPRPFFPNSIYLKTKKNPTGES